MSPLPAEFTDRWRDRSEATPGEGLVYWHMLVGQHPEVAAMAEEVGQRLAPFGGMHLTPANWLHMTVLIAGPSAQIPDHHIQEMAASADRLLASRPPIPVTLGRILYHPEAIMLAVDPAEALAPIRAAALAATEKVTGTGGRSAIDAQWTPHITVCYSEARQPAAPVIAAVGRHLPERRIEVSAVSLVIQKGPERLWDWHPVATVRLGA